MEISASFLLFVFSAAFTPGPNNIMIMASGVNHGVMASVPHLLGIAVGVPTMFLAVGFGLSYTFEQISWLHALIQILGIFYLLYLAWLIANSSKPSFSSDESSQPFTFLQAALFQWVNPKAWMLGTGAIATFTTVGGDLNSQILIMAAVFFVMTLPSVFVWLVFGSWLKKILTKSSHLVIFNRTMAGLLVLSVLPVLKGLALNYNLF